MVTLTRAPSEPAAPVVRPPASAGLLEKARFVHTNRRLGELAGYDVVHAHCSTMSPLSYATIGAAGQVPTAITVHSLWRRYTAFYGGADHLLRWSRWPVAWSAVSTVAATAVQRAARSELRVDVVPNGIDLGEWPAHQHQPVARHLRIVSVMRLAPRKRPLPLLRILRQVRASLPPHIRVSAVIVGDGPRMGAARRFIASHDMTSWVTFTGHLPRARIDEHLANADVFVAPSTLESFGIAALEAAASGIPVIGRSGTGMSDFLDLGVSGLLLPSDAGIAAALADVGLGAITLHAPSHEQLSQMSWSAVVERTDRLYERAGAMPIRRPLQKQAS